MLNAKSLRRGFEMFLKISELVRGIRTMNCRGGTVATMSKSKRNAPFQPKRTQKADTTYCARVRLRGVVFSVRLVKQGPLMNEYYKHNANVARGKGHTADSFFNLKRTSYYIVLRNIISVSRNGDFFKLVLTCAPLPRS